MLFKDCLKTHDFPEVLFAPNYEGPQGDFKVGYLPKRSKWQGLSLQVLTLFNPQEVSFLSKPLLRIWADTRLQFFKPCSSYKYSHTILIPVFSWEWQDSYCKQWKMYTELWFEKDKQRRSSLLCPNKASVMRY